MTQLPIRVCKALALAVLLLCAPPGCKDDPPEVTTLHLEGTVEKIDLANKRVWIQFFSEKHNRKVTQEARVTDQTEVLINGVLSRLEDVKEGEGAEGDVVITGRGEDRVITVARVSIRRSEPISAQPTTAPASTGSGG